MVTDLPDEIGVPREAKGIFLMMACGMPFIFLRIKMFGAVFILCAFCEHHQKF